MVYIEYVRRLPGVGLQEFHEGMAQAQGGWDAGYAEDQLVLSAARTWRLGPEPEHMGVWYSPGAGLERIDQWDHIFRSGEASKLEESLQRVARIDRAGCYDALIEPVRMRGGTYYAEFFRATEGLPAVQTFFQQRTTKHPLLTLGLLVYRIGWLGPEPGGVAIWTIPNFAALGGIARELENVHQPLELVVAGTYADVGEQII